MNLLLQLQMYSYMISSKVVFKILSYTITILLTKLNTTCVDNKLAPGCKQNIMHRRSRRLRMCAIVHCITQLHNANQSLVSVAATCPRRENYVTALYKGKVVAISRPEPRFCTVAISFYILLG